MLMDLQMKKAMIKHINKVSSQMKGKIYIIIKVKINLMTKCMNKRKNKAQLSILKTSQVKLNLMPLLNHKHIANMLMKKTLIFLLSNNHHQAFKRHKKILFKILMKIFKIITIKKFKAIIKHKKFKILHRHRHHRM